LQGLLLWGCWWRLACWGQQRQVHRLLNLNHLRLHLLELLLMLWLLLLMAAWHVAETVVATPGKLSACLSLAVDPASLQERELPGWEQPKVSLQNLLPLPSNRLL
jgi:hypothetical protein